MSELPANWTPPPPPPAPPETKRQMRTAWKPLLITLFMSGGLALVTCAGGFAFIDKRRDSGVVLIFIALGLGALFLSTLAATVVYFFIRLAQGTRAK